MTPLVWNTLHEAATYLTKNTGREWTKKEVLSAAIKHPISRHRNLTFLQVAMPRETKFGFYVFDMDIGGLNPFKRKFSSNWQAVRLRHFQTGDLLIHGEVEISVACSPDEDGVSSEDEYIFIEPLKATHIANLDMVGINERDLLRLANIIKTEALSSYEPPILVTNSAADANKNIDAVATIGEYSTKDMRIMALAVNEFWVNHDPNRPPKKEAVVAWLVKNDVSERTAKSMDTIMRSDKAKKGGNKRLSPLGAST
jgi:hypothetical protein